MNSDEALELVREILSEQLGVDPAETVPEANLREDLGLDSIDAVDLVGAVETRFGANIDEREVAGMVTVADMLVAVLRLAPARTGQ